MKALKLSLLSYDGWQIMMAFDFVVDFDVVVQIMNKVTNDNY
jgi:hypothetical protein